ncbi:MAG TPA: TolC family protein [Terriglobales bacterium]|jgi:outer membrane protein TolC|nr:TolC family protein [Terriglobales bacterium]
MNTKRSAFAVFTVVIATAVFIALSCAFTEAQAQQTNPPSTASPTTITLQDALTRAQKNEPQYRAALAQYGVARANAVQGRAALLPNVSFASTYLYTQGNGTPASRFIANNGVHEYLDQGNVHQALSWQTVAEYRLARAQAALAKAQAEIATRGLVVTVTQAYYGAIVSQRKYSIAQRAAAEAQNFFDITQKLERGGEVAHSDTIKAQLQFEQQQRALQDAQLAMDRSRLDLAVLIFPNFNENFTTVDDLENLGALPSYAEVETMAGRANPQLQAALASMQAANQELAVAWNGFLPSLTLDYFYGIDANQFAVNGFDETVFPHRPVQNLGYSAVATLNLPIWNWGATRSKVKSAGLLRDQAKVELSFAQRKMAADLRDFFNEAQTSRSELESLRQSAELAAESLRLTGLRYRAGEATALEVVDSQNTLTQAQNALGDGQVRYRVAVASLQTLTGKF